MSVLVEAICVVVRRTSLNRKFPGGVDAFLSRASSRLSSEHRYICSDESFVCLSYYTPDAADRGAAPLIEAGLTEIEGDEFVDFAMVDQQYGPTLPCHWLAWSRDPEGFTCAWLAGELPGELSAPREWTPEQSRRLARFDIRNIPDRAMKLADENGVETWLDFMTGRITMSMPRRPLMDT